MDIRGRWIAFLAVAPLFGQMPQGLDLNALKQSFTGGQSLGTGSSLPGPSNLPVSGVSQPFNLQSMEDQRLDFEIRMLKAAETGPARFASDLFDIRQRGPIATDGGVAEDYVLGTGDQIYLNATGSAGFDLSAQVDGRGEIAIPKLGSAKVGGLTLGQAKAAVQRLVSRNYSRTTVDLQVIKLREIRISVLGEVYKPGSYLVPSLGSLVNVLSLAGGPTAIGSYRDVRVVRGGRILFSLDLYPLRAEGLGNPNFALQSGDVVFVPLATDLVRAEGAFARVARQVPKQGALEPHFLAFTPEDEHRDALVREYRAILVRLDPVMANQLLASATLPPSPQGQPVADLAATSPLSLNAALGLNGAFSTSSLGQAQGNLGLLKASPGAGAAPAPLSPSLRLALENRLVYLRNELQDLDAAKRADHRLEIDPITKKPRPALADESQPDWQRRWEQSGKPPVLSFEMKPGETVADLLRYAGGLVPEAGQGPISVRSRDTSGRFIVASVPADVAEAARVALHPGDVVSAFPARATLDQQVQVEGWARVPGTFARTEGLRVGDLLKRDQQALPDTYLHRGEIVRTLPDGTSQFLTFDVVKAMAGDPPQNLLLANKDRIELYRTDDVRLQKTVTLLGPVARPGVYEFHQGMRVADLIFRGGVPQKNADRFEAELARTENGKASRVQRLDLAKLLSTDQSSPVALTDDSLNPLLQPDDQLSLFEKPGYTVHRTVLIQGQVAHPGSYALDREHETLSQVVARAGGLTEEAMPEAGIFLRQIGEANASSVLASALASNQRGGTEPGLANSGGQVSPDATAAAQDPASNGVNEILSRLNETKRHPLSGQLLASPLLHGLASGNINRLVVDFGEALKGGTSADVEMVDGDTVVIPKKMEVAYLVGEAASPFAAYKVEKGETVRDLLRMAGGPTRNADTWNIRLLKADGRIVDSWVMRKKVEPGDTVLVPQRIRRDTTWQENLQALTPIAILLNTLK